MTVLLDAFLLAIVCPALAAQAQVELTPTVGMYIPSGDIINQFGAGCGCQVVETQQAAFLLGVRLAVWPSRTIGLETSVGFASSGVHLTAQNFAAGDTTGTVWLISERVLLNLSPKNGTTAFHLAGGVAYVAHNSDAYQGFSGTSNFAFVLGAGLRIKVGGSTIIRTELEDFLYTTQLSAPAYGFATDAQSQNDLVLSLGLGIKL